MSEQITRIARTVSWRHDFIRAHNYRCHYCNRFAASVESGPDGRPWHVEHMTPLASGGEDAEENLTLACERCNSVKHTLPYENFRRYAQGMFWVGEPGRLDDQDLESLVSNFLRTSDGTWYFRTPDDDGTATCAIRARQPEELGDDADDPVGDFDTSDRRRGGMHNVYFVVQAHRLMPQLISEIHLLRAELAEARGEVDDTALNQSAA